MIARHSRNVSFGPGLAPSDMMNQKVTYGPHMKRWPGHTDRDILKTRPRHSKCPVGPIKWGDRRRGVLGPGSLSLALLWPGGDPAGATITSSKKFVLALAQYLQLVTTLPGILAPLRPSETRRQLIIPTINSKSAGRSPGRARAG